jgi:type IV pilus assembly protein PilV
MKRACPPRLEAPAGSALSLGQRGASMIEVLIALLLVAVTMLGLLGLQLRSMGLQKDSFERRNAALLASSFAERVTANFAGFEAGNYSGTLLPDGTVPTLADCATAGCTAANIASRDFAAFARQVRMQLPGGAAAVATGAGNTGVLITVGWRDPQRATDTTSADGTCEAGGLVASSSAADVTASYRCFRIAVYP